MEKSGIPRMDAAIEAALIKVKLPTLPSGVPGELLITIGFYYNVDPNK